MNKRPNTPAIRRAVIAVTLSGTAALSCHKNAAAPEQPEDAASQPDDETSTEATSAPEEVPSATLPRVVIPANGSRAVDAPERVENAVLPAGEEAAPIRPLAPRPDVVEPGDGPQRQPTSAPTSDGSGQGNGGASPLGEGVEVTPDVVEPRVDPDITACSPIVDGVCPLECTRQNDRDCCEVVGRGGVCSYDEQRGCRCAVIGPFNPPELAA